MKGGEPQNATAYKCYIYLYGTPEENRIGIPASYGCVRMESGDVIDLFDIVGQGARVFIANLPLQGQAVPAP
ncbi:MAG: L,D-transpeptidase [Verrucomicrobiales bacterium]|nr:L,D-transpeptidase [Verrucomicrobiales bacterium]